MYYTDFFYRDLGVLNLLVLSFFQLIVALLFITIKPFKKVVFYIEILGILKMFIHSNALLLPC